MYKLFYFIVSLSLLLVITSCDSNKWEIRTMIEPKILYMDSKTQKLSIQYQLGPYLILDDLNVLKLSYIEYIKNSDDIKLRLYVKYGNMSTDNGFYYFFENIQLCTFATTPINLMTLQKRHSEISGFKWLIQNAVMTESEKKKIKKEKNQTGSLKRM